MATFVTIRQRRHPLVADVVFTAVMVFVCVAGAVGESHPKPNDPQPPASAAAPWPAYLLVAAAALALFWRHRKPLWALIGSTVFDLTYAALGYVNGAALMGPLIATYAYAATSRSPQVRWTAGTVRTGLVVSVAEIVLLTGVTSAFNPFGVVSGDLWFVPSLAAVATLAGLAVANQRAYVQAVRQRAELAERTREDEARRRVDAERLRIARELHDVVAHTMSTINLRAGVAAHLARGLPEPVAEALAAIRDSSKNGLRELRAILAVLRSVEEDEPTGPTPGLAELPLLVDTVRSAGLPVSVEVVGERRPLSAAVELAAYRIVQESLTNTLRHAGPATATVRLGYAEGHLDVEVVDTGTGPGPGSDSGGAGHGLIGMRERALAAGGTLAARPRPEGGFLVSARIPWGEPA